MKVRILHNRLSVVFLIAGILTLAVGVCSDEERPDWWKAQRHLSDMLMKQETDIAELATRILESKPANAQEALLKVSVLMRARMNREAIEALRELKELAPGLDNYQVSSIYYDACDNLYAWDIAKATAEVFADNISEMAVDNRLLKHFLDSGWTVEKVDTWLASRPKGIQHFWLKERLRFNVRQGRGEGLVKELSDSVRKNPQDIEGAVALLDALIYARHSGREEWNLSWMAESVKAKFATEAEEIASRLKNLKEWQTAAVFYRKAINTEITEEEVRKLGMMYSIYVPPKRIRAMFTAHTREGLAECLLKLGENKEAQKWMVAAADIREKHNLGLNALFAGQVQAESGQRTIEGRIKEDEKESEDDPKYWQKRAHYYRGRNEPAQEEEALVKGLALTTQQPEPEPPLAGRVDWRNWLLADYADFLARQKRIDDAVVLLRKEIEQAPATSGSAKVAAHLLARDFKKQISADDPVLWNWLANRPKWEYTEEDLLWRMLESAQRRDLDRYFSRAEKLADGNHPSRARTLGWIMNCMHFPKQSIPLLKHAVENADNKELKEHAAFTLFRSYLDTGDWKHAEEVFPGASKRLTPKELPEWYSKVAVTAAKDGATSDAMRIWRGVANLNPSQIDGLEDLAKAGLTNELKEFYLKMRKKMPSSEAPARALMALEKK